MSRFSAKTTHLNQVNFKYKLYQEEEQKTIKKMLNIIPPKNNGKLKPIQLKKIYFLLQIKIIMKDLYLLN